MTDSIFRFSFSSFTYLNITQFLGALNDNIFKLLIAFFLIQQMGSDNSPFIMATTGATFVLPFLLFSANSGTLADRFSKRNIIVFTKILELVVMSLGFLSFVFKSVPGAYGTLFMMATQSAIFGPSKYGIIPELVKSDKLSLANGMLTSLTFIAIIIGTFLAAFITDITDRNFVMASLFCTMVALAGVIISFGIEYTPPVGEEKSMTLRLVSQVYKNVNLASETPLLVPAIFGSSFFLFVGGFIQLNMIPFAVEHLGLSEIGGGYLFLVSALGIGVGSAFAGRYSKNLKLVPYTTWGIAIAFFLVYLFSNSLFAVIPLIVITGGMGGMYQVPLDAFIQQNSPEQQRGQMVATSNFLSFLGVLVASFMIFFLSDVVGLTPAQGFAVMSACSIPVAVYYTLVLRS